jgi:hypothetical protein
VSPGAATLPTLMARRKHRARDEGVNWTLVLVPLLLVGVAVGAFLYFRKGEEAPPRRAAPAKPFTFTRGQTHFVSVGGSASKLTPEQRESARAGVDVVMNDLYDAGFVTKSRWEKGAFTSVFQHFAEAAAEQSRADLAELTLGPEAERLQSVKPENGVLEISFLMNKQEPVAAIAETYFQAQGKLSGGGALSVTHEGKFFLRLIDGVWRIVGYEVDGNLDSGSAVTPTPVETTP